MANAIFDGICLSRSLTKEKLAKLPDDELLATVRESIGSQRIELELVRGMLAGYLAPR